MYTQEIFSCEKNKIFILSIGSKCCIREIIYFYFLETPWLLYGIIIALATGYVLAISGVIIYGCDKLITKIRIFRGGYNEPVVIQLRNLQEQLHQDCEV